jgi:hypothetical protein
VSKATAKAETKGHADVIGRGRGIGNGRERERRRDKVVYLATASARCPFRNGLWIHLPMSFVTYIPLDPNIFISLKNSTNAFPVSDGSGTSNIAIGC